MYNEKIEQLIKAALADGVLTEKEKQILFKRAQEQGVDLDEFEMVLDARLVELQKAEKEKAEKSAPKSTKFGDVRKCPVCGALVPALSGVCQDCGYEFSGIGANSSSQILAKKIEEINENYSRKANELKKDKNETQSDLEDRKWEILHKQRVMAISQAIKSFSIPNTKADMFEFLTTMQSNMLSPGAYKLEADAYFTKYNETIVKAKALFKNDSVISDLLANSVSVIEDYKKIHKKQKRCPLKPSVKETYRNIVIGVGALGLILLLAWIYEVFY